MKPLPPLNRSDQGRMPAAVMKAGVQERAPREPQAGVVIMGDYADTVGDDLFHRSRVYELAARHRI